MSLFNLNLPQIGAVECEMYKFPLTNKVIPNQMSINARTTDLPTHQPALDLDIQIADAESITCAHPHLESGSVITFIYIYIVKVIVKHIDY